MARYLSLVPGLLCLGVGTFLAYGLQYVTENYSWYLGYMIGAFLIGLWVTYTSVREFAKK